MAQISKVIRKLNQRPQILLIGLGLFCLLYNIVLLFLGFNTVDLIKFGGLTVTNHNFIKLILFPFVNDSLLEPSLFISVLAICYYKYLDQINVVITCLGLIITNIIAGLITVNINRNSIIYGSVFFIAFFLGLALSNLLKHNTQENVHYILALLLFLLLTGPSEFLQIGILIELIGGFVTQYCYKFDM